MGVATGLAIGEGEVESDRCGNFPWLRQYIKIYSSGGLYGDKPTGFSSIPCQGKNLRTRVLKDGCTKGRCVLCTNSAVKGPTKPPSISRHNSSSPLLYRPLDSGIIKENKPLLLQPCSAFCFVHSFSFPHCFSADYSPIILSILRHAGLVQHH